MRFSALLAGVGAVCLLVPLPARARQPDTVSVSAYPVASSLDPGPGGSSPVLEPALAPAPDGSAAEWFVLSGRQQDVASITPGGAQALVATGLASDAGPPVTYASVTAEGYDWVLDNDQGPGNVLYAVGAADSESPGLNPVARFGDYGQDMALGPDGALYIADNSGLIRCRITPAPSADCQTVAIPPPFYNGAGAFAVGGSGEAEFFTDGLGELGSYGPGGFSGPLPAQGDTPASTDPGTIAVAANGNVYIAGGAATNAGANDEILELSPGAPEQVSVVASGLGNVVSLTVGPDGNIWFLNAAGAGSVGVLDTASGAVSQYGLPSGVSLPAGGVRIAAGPSTPNAAGDGEVFFTATASSSGAPEIGVVSGIPFAPTPGALTLKSAVAVSRSHLAVLELTCSGQANAGCVGEMVLSIRARLRLLVPVRGGGRGARARYRRAFRRERLTLGRFSFDLTGGRTARVRLRLKASAYRLLEQVAGGRLNARITARSKLGTVAGNELTFTAPATRRSARPPARRRAGARG